MDRLMHYRTLFKDSLKEFQRLYNLQPTPGVEAHCIFDETNDHYLLIDLGWQETYQTHHSLEEANRTTAQRSVCRDSCGQRRLCHRENDRSGNARIAENTFPDGRIYLQTIGPISSVSGKNCFVE